ncbi:MAG TPA: hypothetical protein VNA20_08945 [Frankiaceae bacterium]|nr:hypothetical protein [Frankiaceae bacterium]
MTRRTGVALATAAVLASLLTPAPDPRDVALGDRRSLLAFLPDAVTSGRFEIRHGNRPAYWRGVFWRTPRGNAYLRARPYDRALVEREVSALADRVRRAVAADPDAPLGVDPARIMPLAGGPFYTGDELQYGLEEYLADLLGPATLSFHVVGDDDTCPRAYEAHRAAARRAVAALRPRWTPVAGGRERWHFGVSALRRDTRDTRQAAERACTDAPAAPAHQALDSDVVSGVVVEVDRSARGVSFTVLDAGNDVDHTVAPLVVEVTPAPVGAPPAAPLPAPPDGVVRMNEFLLAVAACGALPWEYSTFAAANDYTAPTAAGYYGPTALSTGWACADRVPAADRADPD